jgi:hypothetical protein
MILHLLEGCVLPIQAVDPESDDGEQDHRYRTSDLS